MKKSSLYNNLKAMFESLNLHSPKSRSQNRSYAIPDSKDFYFLAKSGSCRRGPSLDESVPANDEVLKMLAQYKNRELSHV